MENDMNIKSNNNLMVVARRLVRQSNAFDVHCRKPANLFWWVFVI